MYVYTVFAGLKLFTQAVDNCPVFRRRFELARGLAAHAYKLSSRFTGPANTLCAKKQLLVARGQSLSQTLHAALWFASLLGPFKPHPKAPSSSPCLNRVIKPNH